MLATQGSVGYLGRPMTSTGSTDEPVIAVAGAAAVDMTLRQPPRDWIGQVGHDVYAKLHRLETPPEAGLGGNGAAAAYVLGKLGMTVLLNASISDDPMGQLIRGWLDDAGVRCISPRAASSMVSITAADVDGRRLGTLQHAGSDIDWCLSAEPSEATWLLIGVHAQVGELELPQVRAALTGFRGRGPRVLDSGVGWTQDIKPEQLHELWAEADLLIGTAEELAHWTGCTEPEAIAEFVLGKGPGEVVVKMGADGAAYQSHDLPFEHQAACPVSRSDVSIGAGDAFNGGLVAALARGVALSSSVAQAQQTAAGVVATGRGVLGWGQTPAETNN